jgi:hypothetical protein
MASALRGLLWIKTLEDFGPRVCPLAEIGGRTRMRRKRETHDGQLFCPSCKLWKHPSRFRRRQRQTPHSTMWHFNPTCRLCEQTERTDQKNQDRAKACIESRAGTVARYCGVSRAFVWTDLNYRALVPMFRGLLTDPEAVCQNCAHAFLGERDIQLDHRAPPRNRHDWARYHARNIGLSCGSCNRAKTSKEYDDWLDQEESNRVSANAHQTRQTPNEPPPGQLSLF